MTRQHWISNISSHAMALKAAWDGNLKLFEAIVDITKIDVAELAAFKSHADVHLHDTFFLVYQVASTGNVSFLKRLITHYGLSPYVMEDMHAQVSQKKAQYEHEKAETEARGERMTMIADDAYWYLLSANPYRQPTLLAYVESLCIECESTRDALLKKKRRNTSARKAAETAIAGRSINEKKFQQYLNDLYSFTTTATMLVDCVSRKPSRAKVPLYEAERRRRLCIEAREALDAQHSALAHRLRDLKDCREFIKTIPPYQAVTA